MKMRLFALVTLCLLWIGFGYAQRDYSVPVAAIAAGKELWVNSGDTSRDFQVDVGALRQVGDEMRAQYRRRLTGEALENARQQHPRITLPEGSEEWIEGAFTCGDTPTELILKDSIKSPKGRILFSGKGPSGRTYNESASNYFLYNRTVAGLVCWSAARKCQGKDLIWPAPKEVFDRWPPARGGRVESFVPACKLDHC